MALRSHLDPPCSCHLFNSTQTFLRVLAVSSNHGTLHWALFSLEIDHHPWMMLADKQHFSFYLASAGHKSFKAFLTSFNQPEFNLLCLENLQ
jgi:hypothetical protein